MEQAKISMDMDRVIVPSEKKEKGAHVLHENLAKWANGKVVFTPEEIKNRLAKGKIADADQISARLTEESSEMARQKAIKSLRNTLNEIN